MIFEFIFQLFCSSSQAPRLFLFTTRTFFSVVLGTIAEVLPSAIDESRRGSKVASLFVASYDIFCFFLGVQRFGEVDTLHLLVTWTSSASYTFRSFKERSALLIMGLSVRLPSLIDSNGMFCNSFAQLHTDRLLIWCGSVYMNMRPVISCGILESSSSLFILQGLPRISRDLIPGIGSRLEVSRCAYILWRL